MAKKQKGRSRRVCLLEECGAYAVAGLKVCRQHSTVNALQQEVERLRDGHSEGAWRLGRYSEIRQLVKVMRRVDARAVDPSSNGMLGAALSIVKDLADDVERITGTRARRPTGRVARCGRDGCSHRDRAQRIDYVYCGHCGGLMPDKTPHTEPREPQNQG